MNFLIKLLLAILIVAGCFLSGFIYYRIGTVSLNFFEKNQPSITTDKQITGIGLETAKLSFNLEDQQSGLDLVQIKIEQDGKSTLIAKETFPQKTYSYSLPIELNAKNLGLKEGSAIIKASLFDRSFSVNSNSIEIPIKVRYGKPKIFSLTPQQNIAIGGMELVFYRAKNSSKTGVQVGENFFPGFQSMLLDDRFIKYDDVYFAFFALPYNFDKSKDKVQLVAKDDVGNSAYASFPHLVIPRKFKKVDIKLNDTLLDKVYSEVFPEFIDETNNQDSKNLLESNEINDKLAAFKLINENYRKFLLDKIFGILSRTENKKLSDWEWIRPMNAAPTSAFCEDRTYTYNGTPVSQSLHAGVDLADVGNSPVKAANSGKIVFAGSLGIYGEAIIIDHGFGMSSLYGHLSSINVSDGQLVSKGDVIANSGATGLAGGDHLHFELRLHTVPVYPIEWWDYSWVKAHMIDKIEATIKQLEIS
jgi:murein DD-endopeptidase MepM/ murein hydrolase activator NlpD